MEAKLIMTVEEMKDQDKWLKLRNSGIGGSDAAAVLGLNKWKSPFQLWLEKTGQTEPDDLSQNEYVYWGNVLEQVVADRFCELKGKKVRHQGMMANNKSPWLLANVDRMVVGENAGLECKTANGFATKEWEDDKLPTTYYCQCQHYMMATGCDKWYIAVLIGGNHFVWKEIPRNEDDIKALYDAEKQFWEVNVLQSIMPDVDGSDSCTKALQNKFTGGQVEAVAMPNESVKLLELIDGFEHEKEEVENNLNETKNKLCLLLGNNEVGYAGDRKVTWKVQNGRTSVDSKRMKMEIPNVYQKYVKIGAPYRKLNIQKGAR